MNLVVKAFVFLMNVSNAGYFTDSNKLSSITVCRDFEKNKKINEYTNILVATQFIQINN